jgi:hypothetical protein
MNDKNSKSVEAYKLYIKYNLLIFNIFSHAIRQNKLDFLIYLVELYMKYANNSLKQNFNTAG